MKLGKLYHGKKCMSTLLLLLIFSSALVTILPTRADGTIISIEPSVSTADPSEQFTINITITDVTDLFAYEVKIRFDARILDVKSADVVKGPFIPGTVNFAKSIKLTPPEQAYILVVCTRIGVFTGVSGSGTLFSVKFTVKAPGVSDLHLYDTQLRDSTLTPIAHTTSDGSFHTHVPVPSFSFSPDTYGRPIVGESVTFNASESYDPDGGSILFYTWDFGDGANSTGIIVSHVYTAASTPNPYNVTLTVEDDQGQNYTGSQLIDVKFHDIAIIEIVTPKAVLKGDAASIDVTVLNNGTHADTFNVSAYYLNPLPILIGTQTYSDLVSGANTTLTFDWATLIAQTTENATIAGIGAWIDPIYVNASDNLYAYANTNNTYQEYRGYPFDAVGWKGISKVEVGIEVKTDLGGDDQLGIRVSPQGSTWSGDYVYNITSTTDTFFWIDVTGTLTWQPTLIDKMRVRIEYIQVGGTATPIYVDWLPVRITPSNPTDIPLGVYGIWANAYLVGHPTPDYRPGEEEDLADNSLSGDPITVTAEAVRDIAITDVTVIPTEVKIGTYPYVWVEIENQGNSEETFDVFVEVNSQEVGSEAVERLTAGGSTRISIRFTHRVNDTTVEGVYNITAYTSSIADEENVTNNKLTAFVTIQILPVPSFTYSPQENITVGDNVVFSASASYAPGIPGGTIEYYAWDFGDGTPLSNSTHDVVSHKFQKPGTYRVALTVTDNEALKATLTRSVQVQKLASNITISASLLTVPLSLNSTISGSIEPERANATISINYTRVGDSTWAILANVSTNDEGQYSYEWMPLQEGDYQFIAKWQGDDITEGAESSALNVVVIVRDIAIIDVSLSRFQVTPGESLTIRVKITNRGTAAENVTVNVYYNDTLLDTITFTGISAGSDGSKSIDWDTQGIEEGIYIIKAVAEPLLGETYTVDNTRTGVGVVIQGSPATQLNIFLFTTVALAVAVAAMAFYLFRTIKSKPK